MKREDDQELWDLLGTVGQPQLSPFFARNVARQLREEKSWRDHVFSWFQPRQLIPAAAVALAILAATISPMRVSSPDLSDSPDSPPATLASIDPQDYDTVADLDDLLTPDDEGLWNDTDSSPL